MADSWNPLTPQTYSVDEIVTAAKLNQELRDRMQALFNGLVGDGSADADVLHRHRSGTLAARPGAVGAGRTYYATDVKVLFLDTGSAWVVIGVFPAAARAYYAAALTIGTGGAGLALPFDSERFDNDSIHSTVTNTSRFTCQTAGIYSIFGSLTFAANATGRRQVGIRINGATTIAIHEQNASPVNETFLDIATLYQLAVADYVEMVGYQDSGSSLSVIFANYSPEFGMTRVGYI